MPNYSYERTYSRLDLAKEQLETAIFLFLDYESYAAALTLAGAAEEIFGRELIRRGQQHILDWKYENISGVFQKLHRKTLPRKEFFAEENYIRNALKHFGDEDELELTCDLQDVSSWMLVRACENARRLGLELRRFDEFNNWFHEYVVGILG